MITSIRLQQFRSYTDAAFEFNEKVNIIIGPNASGKTNLLEALLYVSQGNSFRSADKDNIQQDKDWARIDGVTITNQERIIKILSDKSKKIHIDKKEYKKINQEQQIPIVLFEPSQIYLLTTSPDQRRAFIDTIVQQVDDSYQDQRNRYARALSQRNRLLKQTGERVQSSIFAWNLRLSELGSVIAQKRTKIINRMNEEITAAYQSIASNKDSLSVEYKTQQNMNDYASSMLRNLEISLNQDMQRGFTSFGPHRDDVQILINKNDIRGYASRGEVRTVFLALKSQEARLLKEHTKKLPILLLDDVFSELDGKRRQALTGFLKGHQSFITTTDADIVAKSYSQKAAIISLGKS